MPNATWIRLIGYGLAFLLLFGLADRVRDATGRPEAGRKLAHVGTGLLSLTFPIAFGRGWPVYLLCGAFLAMLVVSQRWGFWRGINGVERTTYGSVAFPLAVAALWWLAARIDTPALFALPLGVLTFADPAAAAVGQNWPRGRFRVGTSARSVSGSLAFFAVALLSCSVLVWLGLAPRASAVLVVNLAAVATVTEVVSQRGWDNFWIPVSGAAVVLLATQYESLS